MLKERLALRRRCKTATDATGALQARGIAAASTGAGENQGAHRGLRVGGDADEAGRPTRNEFVRMKTKDFVGAGSGCVLTDAMTALARQASLEPGLRMRMDPEALQAWGKLVKEQPVGDQPCWGLARQGSVSGGGGAAGAGRRPPTSYNTSEAGQPPTAVASSGLPVGWERR